MIKYISSISNSNHLILLVYYKMQLQLITIALLLALVTAASNSPRDVYQAELNKIIATLNNNLDSLTKSLSNTLTTQQHFKTQNTLALQVLIQGISNFRADLRNAINDTAIPYNLCTWKCNSSSFQNYNKIASSNQQILVNTKNIETQISTLAASPQVNELRNRLDLLKKETNLLQSQFKYLCPVSSVDNNGKPIGQPTVPPQPLQPTVPTTIPPQPTTSQPGAIIPASQKWVSNLDNPTNNWIFGNINPKTYYADVNKLITDGAHLCPPQTPYVDTNNKCITCQYLYDANLKACVACPPGSTYNQTIHQCDSSGGTYLKNSYSGFQNYIGTLPQTITDLSTCPLTAPYFNGKQCIACPLPNYYDFSLNVCAQCEKDKTFDMTYKICKPLNNSVTPQFPVFNSNLAASGRNYVGIVPPVVAASTCPEGQPFFNGLNCISCTLPLYFNFTSSACSSCPASQKFDPETKTCILDVTKVLYVSSLSGVSNYIGNPPNIPVNNEKKILGCPAETPFSANSLCIACALPKFFNFQTNQCQLCAADLTFDTTLKKCVPKKTTQAGRNNNLEGTSNFMYQVPNFNSNLPTCPAATPYFNGTTCIPCSYPMYFNFKTLQCQNCPTGLKFNTLNRECEYEKQTFVTDTSNQNVLFNGNYSNLLNDLNNKRVQQGLRTCPKETPYYDATRNVCINCPAETPIFNIRYNKCISCGKDAFFNKYTRICTHRMTIAPTLERTLMNTFRI